MNTSIARAISQFGGQAAFAKACGVTQAAVSKWTRGQRVSAESAIAIEKATDGAVTKEELRPDLFSTATSEPSKDAA
jgi:DNA-binding transcriptional regulator YdaS (Cro superfamily)